MGNQNKITLDEIKSIMEEICKKCWDGKAGWCGDCHFDELQQELNTHFHFSSDNE